MGMGMMCELNEQKKVVCGAEDENLHVTGLHQRKTTILHLMRVKMLSLNKNNNK